MCNRLFALVQRFRGAKPIQGQMAGLHNVCVWNVFQTPASKVKDFLQKSKPFDKGLLVDIMGYQKSDKS